MISGVSYRYRVSSVNFLPQVSHFFSHELTNNNPRTSLLSDRTPMPRAMMTCGRELAREDGVSKPNSLADTLHSRASSLPREVFQPGHRLTPSEGGLASDQNLALPTDAPVTSAKAPPPASRTATDRCDQARGYRSCICPNNASFSSHSRLIHCWNSRR